MSATLADIQTKVRRLTRSPSISQISDADLKTYINDFILYDMPEHLRLFTFRRVLKFYTSPYIDEYPTNTINADDPLYNFKNAYITSHDPIYIAGKLAYFTQSRMNFYSLFIQNQQKYQIGTGDGATTLYTGTLAHPLIQKSVLFTSYDANGAAIVLKDVPQIDGVTGIATLLGDLYVPDDTSASLGTINYKTGDYSLTFPVAPDASAEIYAQYVTHTPGLPTSVLYFNNTFFLRPVPDISYEVKVETYVRPDALVNDADYPELEQHWQYISYGAAKKIFEDRMDMESVQLITPEFEKQQELCERRTLVQTMNERASTIYTEQVKPSASSWSWFSNP